MRGLKVAAWKIKPGCWREARDLSWHMIVSPVFYLSWYVYLQCLGLRLMEITLVSTFTLQGRY